MNGGHDLGGMMGFGPIAPEPGEPVFRAGWERRIFALSLAMGMAGAWTIDQVRQARESMPPGDYWSSSYYEIWLAGLERLVRERGIAERDGVDSRLAALGPKPPKRRSAAEVSAIIGRGGPASRAAAMPARFSVGDTVRTRNIHPKSHTRLPRYLRGHAGTVTAIHGAHVFPDSNARGQGEDPRWLYAVSFSAGALWGRGTADKVSADLWEPYLEPAA